ncbi:ATP-binding protein [uncultured Eubacterium sp.]|uniref:ATP-binding protein n=1 Tax=Eubacterium sp. TaxID=142586 RepID=UPI0026741D69|nr:MoxR family ATPase [uncultured Eubacterium sp.]
MENRVNDIKLTNVPQMNVGRMTELLANSYSVLINNKKPIKIMPSVMLWGPPGVGKSQAVRQIAKEIEERTGKKSVVTDVRLLLFNPIDLRGIPTSNADKTLAIWLKPQIFQMDSSDDIVNILFLDEISAAPQSVQAAAYQITLDRVVGEHKLPDNCIVIAAGNRVTDKSVAFKMPKALANRLLHIEVEGNFDSWKEWAIKSGVNDKVIGFLSFRRNYLMNFDAKSEDLAFSTPRSWEMVSNVLNNINDDVSEVYPLITGLVGAGVAVEFRTWCNVYNQLPDMDDIFNGLQPRVPKSSDVMYALTAAMTSYAREHKEEITKIANSIRYAEKLPPDFGVVLMKDYMYIEKDYKRKLMTIPEFAKWLSTKGKVLNGVIK